MFLSILLSWSLFLIGNAAHLPVSHTSLQCQPFYTTFNAPSLNQDTSFIAISPENSYKTGAAGLQMYMERPDGKITTKEGINDKVADGATINSTFTILHGKITYELSAPTYPGVVTAVILIADEGDEMDIELLGSDPSHFQTNIFAPKRTDHGPLYGVFSSVEDMPNGSGSKASPSIEVLHSYTIDWNGERIIWSVDGKEIRTLRRDQTMHNSALHFPSHPARIQLGIWDASSPAGTAEWAGGPIKWQDVPKRMEAVVKSVRVECP